MRELEENFVHMGDRRSVRGLGEVLAEGREWWGLHLAGRQGNGKRWRMIRDLDMTEQEARHGVLGHADLYTSRGDEVHRE